LQNLLLDSAGNIKICDFGLSKLKSGSGGGRTETQCGTPNYVAPEVLHTEGIYSKEYDPQPADIWTCGVILYVFVTACLPFDDANNGVLYRLIKAAAYKWPKGERIPPGAKNLVHKILEPNPDKRPTIAEIKTDPWFKYEFQEIPGYEGLNDKAVVTPKSQTKGKKMNAFELLSKMNSIDAMGGAGTGTMAFIANRAYKEITDDLYQDIKTRGYSVEQSGIDDPCKCTHKDTGLRFSFEADSVMDEVSVVTFSHIDGNAYDTHDCFCDVALEFKDIIQSKQPVRRSRGEAAGLGAAIEADLKRVSEERKK